MGKIQLKYEDRMTVAELRAALDGLPEDDFIQVYSRKYNESVYITEVEKVDDDYTYLISNDEAWSKNLMSELSTIDALEAQSKKGKWIPVSERLPEVDGRYFTTVKGIDVNYFEIRSFANSLYKIDKFDFSGKEGHGWYFYDYDYGIHGYIEETNVIAWMPIPEPYKGE